MRTLVIEGLCAMDTLPSFSGRKEVTTQQGCQDAAATPGSLEHHGAVAGPVAGLSLGVGVPSPSPGATSLSGCPWSPPCPLASERDCNITYCPGALISGISVFE